MFSVILELEHFELYDTRLYAALNGNSDRMAALKKVGINGNQFTYFYLDSTAGPGTTSGWSERLCF